MKANKAILMLLTSLLMAATALAQESPSKQINQIKRNSAYLYAEATMETPEEALSMARELLFQQVKEYISTNRKLNDADNVLVKDVNAKCETLSMMRGTMHRLFVYVKKNDIESFNNATAINNTTNETKVVVEQPLPPIPAPEKPKPEKTIVEEPIVQIDEPEETPATPAATPNLAAWQQQSIDDLLKCSNVNEVKAKFNRMKAEYKLKKYGTPDKCTAPNDVFWILFNEDGSVNTVLGPGDNDRVNFRNMRSSSLNDFKGKNALWFKFEK